MEAFTMILLHERMNGEAIHLKKLIEEVFAIPVRLLEDRLDRLFVPLPKFEGYLCEPKTILLKQEFPDTAVFLLTQRDLYGGDASKDDEWMFGGNFDQFSVVATARLMGRDSTPRSTLALDRDVYLRRLSLMTIHELGHDLIKNAPHHQEASWVNIRSGTSMPLGRHCDDNSCAMYEVVDISAPTRDEGYLELGNQCVYDAGVDEHLGRLRVDWFCARCRDYVVSPIPESYIGLGS
jgi:predicted Zn-dependent protease